VTRDDVLFFAGCLVACFAAGWCWALCEHFMRVDIHV
jgi:hypothetical protein